MVNDEDYRALKLERDALAESMHKLQKDLQWMVKRAADRNPSLEGYRELGAKIADTERNRDEWIEVARKLRTDRDWWRSKVMRINEYYRHNPDKADCNVDAILES